MEGQATGRETGRRGVGTGALRVALGIGLSRGFGFLREMVLAYFFGVGPHADVFRTALRGPNLLQNLLGEQSLSASFIPVYSRFLAAHRPEDAGRFAGAIFGLLFVTVAAVVSVGVVLAEPIVALLAPGYLGDAALVAAGAMAVDRYPLAVTAVRIIFPMTGFLVLSAWALGVLNSHRRFFVAYMAPALWNAGIIGALILGARVLLGADLAMSEGPVAMTALNELLLAACVGALVGGVLQLAMQLPWVMRLMRGFKVSLAFRTEGVGEALRAFFPLLAGRGAVQLSGYLDFFLGSFLAAGAVAALGWAQTLYLLPISLFGMSVAAAELPELARQSGPAEIGTLGDRVGRGFEQMLFLTVPSMVGYLVFGHLVVHALFRRGRFGPTDNWLVYLVLAAYSCGLVASSSSRLLNNVFYALGRTKVPARVAVERVLLSAVLGSLLMLWLDRFSVARLVGIDPVDRPLFLGAVGLAIGAACASWYELARLSHELRALLGAVRLPWRRAAVLTGLALLSAVPGVAVWYFASGLPAIGLGALTLGVYGLCYAGSTRWLGVGGLRAWFGGTP